MGFDKALGILIIIACLMAVFFHLLVALDALLHEHLMHRRKFERILHYLSEFFLIIRKGVMNDVVDDRYGTHDLLLSYVSFFICYLMFTLVTWGFVMAIIFGIRLIVG